MEESRKKKKEREGFRLIDECDVEKIDLVSKKEDE